MALQNSINAPLPLSATQGGLGVASPTVHGILVAEGASAVTPIVLTNGQMLIGSTGADPVAATIIGGAGITVTAGAGTLTLDAVASEAWVSVSGTTQALAVNANYICNNVGVTTLTLPATAAVGSVIEVTSTSSTYVIAQNAGQTINFMNVATTTGATGTYTSDVVGAAVRLVCVAANTGWQVLNGLGNPVLA